MSTSPRQYAREIYKALAKHPEQASKLAHVIKSNLVDSSTGPQKATLLAEIVRQLKRLQNAESRIAQQRANSAPSPFIELYQRLISR